MMPPKKSKAARSAVQDSESSQVDPPVENGQNQEDKDDESDTPDTNIFKVEIVEGKRPRILPASELYLQKWLSDNLEPNEELGTQLNESDVYDHYLEGCVSSGTKACEQVEVLKMYHKAFPNGVSVKESSPYQGEIRLKKPKKERTQKPKTESSAIKMKDIVMRAFDEIGDREQGIRFNSLVKHIAAKFPAFRVDARPKILLNLLEKWVSYGKLDRVKGVGLCAFYRKPVEVKSEDEDDKENKEKDEKDDEKTEDATEEKKDKQKAKGEKDDAEKDDAEKDDEEETSEAKDEEDKEDGEAGKGKRTKAKDAKKTDSKKAKPKQKAKAKSYRAFVVHSDPQRIEDTFQLAMTFMVEPKEASVKKIHTYIEDHYAKNVNSERLRTCLESGEEHGYWERVTGTGMSGKFRLLMDEFDPSADDDLVGQVTNAMVACTEPKQCAARILKNYLVEYHPEFKTAERPHLYKRSLERALKKNDIRQLTGIGATGTYQLTHPFTPTPSILRGEDKEEDYASDTSDEDDDVVEVASEDEGKGYGKFHISTFQDAYQPRPTKRHGQGRKASTGIHDEPLANKVKRSFGRFRSTSARVVANQPKRKSSKPKKRTNDSDYESNSEEELVKPKKKGGRGSPRKQKRVSYKEKVEPVSETSNEEDTDSEDSAPPPQIKKATGRLQKKQKDKNSKVEAPKRGRGRAQIKQEDSSEDEESEVETPKRKAAAKKTPGRSASAQNKKKPTPRQANKGTSQRSSGRSPQKRGRYTEDASEDEDEAPAQIKQEDSSEDEDSEAEAPKTKAAVKKTPSRSSNAQNKKKPTPRQASKGTSQRMSGRSPQKRGLYTEDSSEDEDEDEAPPKKVTPKKSSQSQKRTSRTPQKPSNMEISDEDVQDSDEEKPKSGRAVPRKMAQTLSSDGESEDDSKKTPVKKTPAKRGKGKGRRR